MGILDRFFGDDHKLTRPDFNRFEHIELDFSGTKLRFKDAAHTAMFPINDWPKDMDIYNTDALEKEDEGFYADRFYVRGWDFFGKKNRVRGGCALSSLIFYFENRYLDDTGCFNREEFEKEVLEYCHDVWGMQNPGSTLGNLGSEVNYVYPVAASDLSYECINGIQWCRFTAEKKGAPPNIVFACPISKQHIIINRFKLSAYDETDFYSPETNLEQTCFDVVSDYMSEFYIELSERAKQERSQVSDPV